MSRYGEQELGTMPHAKLQELRLTVARAGSSGLAGRIGAELARRSLKAGARSGGTAAFYRRRGDWFVERGDWLRILVLHSSGLA